MRHLALLPLMVFCLAPAPARPTDAEADLRRKCDALLEEWRPRFEEAKFNSIVAPPFVIAGNGSPARIRRYTDGTVLAAARALKATYFKTPPAEPVLILLFESEGPYKRLAKEWFGEGSVPHFGFYRRRENVMLMNIRTGTGTLVHEMVHALLAPDFPDAPDWFNEGLASLYEQCSLNGDSIKGHINWRLPALQKAIAEKTLRPLPELIADEDFYADDRVGLNYAQARYLMMYLQEKGLLTDYYARFRDGTEEDLQGLQTLRDLVAPQTLEELEREWRAWVMALKSR